MEVLSELNDLQIKYAEIMAQNLILMKQVAEMKNENLRLQNENEYLLNKMAEGESESDESDESDESVDVAGVMAM